MRTEVEEQEGEAGKNEGKGKEKGEREERQEQRGQPPWRGYLPLGHLHLPGSTSPHLRLQDMAAAPPAGMEVKQEAVVPLQYFF